MQQDKEDLKKDVLLIGTSLEFYKRQVQAKDIELTDVKTELDTEHEHKLKVQKELELATGWLAMAEKQLAETRANLSTNRLATQSNENHMAGMPNTHTIDAAMSYWPRGVGPKKPLTGTDCIEYAPWKWAIKDKLRVDAIMYPTEMDRISYGFSQLGQPVFQQLESWIQNNSETLTLEEFFDKIEHYMGMPMLAATSKREINTITMRPTESVNQYYHRLYQLWEHAGVVG